MRYFLIGDEVYVPKHKIIGTITDKLYKIENNEIMVKISHNNELSNIAYGNFLRDSSKFVNCSEVKSLKSNELYQREIVQTLPDIDDLNIPNLLKKRDIIKGTKIKVVDNYFLERMVSYQPENYLYTKLVLSYLLNKEGVLTGKSRILPNGVLIVECEFKFGVYYVYQHSIQVIKKVNIFKRFFGFFEFFKKFQKGLWPIFIIGIVLILLDIICFVVYIKN